MKFRAYCIIDEVLFLEKREKAGNREEEKGWRRSLNMLIMSNKVTFLSNSDFAQFLKMTSSSHLRTEKDRDEYTINF